MPDSSSGVPTPGLKIDTTTSDDSTVVSLSGRLTAEATAKLKDEVKSLFPRSKRLVLDLSALSFMDSSGLGAVVSIYISARHAGCELRLINLSKQVRELLRLTRVLSLFETCGVYNIRMP